MTLQTPRLLLRPWRPEDRAPFAALNADAETMRYFAHCLDRPASDALAQRISDRLDAQGWGLWAVAPRETGAFIGFIGLSTVGDDLPIGPCVEIGWRLARAHWHRGYATEGAQAALRFAFEALALTEVVSFTAATNTPSRAVMERLGMVFAGETFGHPRVPTASPLHVHVVYRLTAAAWHAQHRS